MSFSNEIKFFAESYKKKGDLKKIIETNSNIAESKKKFHVALIWQNLLNIFFPEKSDY